MSNSSAPPLGQSMPFRPRGMPSGVMIILQAMWIEVVTYLATLATKVTNIEGGVKSWMR